MARAAGIRRCWCNVARQIADLLTIDFTFPETVLDAIMLHATPQRIRQLIDRIDRILFGRSGSLAKSIRSGDRPGANPNWKALSPEYREWKARAKKLKTVLPEAPPNVVISTKLWIRTGKIMEFVTTVGESKWKTVKVYTDKLFTGKPFMEIYVNSRLIPYWKYADDRRQLFFFTDEDREKINRIFEEWFISLLNIALGIKSNAGSRVKNTKSAVRSNPQSRRGRQRR
jgi:hypothetical protein